MTKKTFNRTEAIQILKYILSEAEEERECSSKWYLYSKFIVGIPTTFGINSYDNIIFKFDCIEKRDDIMLKKNWKLYYVKENILTLIPANEHNKNTDPIRFEIIKKGELYTETFKY